MQILEEGIEDNPENYTRFLAISKTGTMPEGEGRRKAKSLRSRAPNSYDR